VLLTSISSLLLLLGRPTSEEEESLDITSSLASAVLVGDEGCIGPGDDRSAASSPGPFLLVVLLPAAVTVAAILAATSIDWSPCIESGNFWRLSSPDDLALPAVTAVAPMAAASSIDWSSIEECGSLLETIFNSYDGSYSNDENERLRSTRSSRQQSDAV
jgi:hypothetical protein